MADIRSAQVIAQVEWAEIIPNEYDGAVIFSLTPEASIIGNFVYTGDVSLTLTPASECVSTLYLYTGDVSFSLIPESEHIGFFCYTGEITLALVPSATIVVEFLYTGDVTLSLSPGAEHEYFYEYFVEGSGGVSIGGEGTVAFFTPSTYTVAAAGGPVIGGEGVEVFILPPVYTVIGEEGIKIFGEGDIAFVEALVYAVIGSGGWIFEGRGSVVFVNVLPTFTLVGFGGYKLNGIGIIAFEEPELLEYTVIGSGGYKLEGEGDFVYVTPDKIFSFIATGEVTLNGAGKIVWFDPDYFSVIGSGGVVISGEGTDEEFIYFTWVFSGVDYKPSIYSGYNFNSYCEFGGKTYGANEDGIFELSGETDEGKDIHTGFILGPHNLGIMNKKRLRSIHLGNKNLATKIRVTLDTISKDFSVTKGKAKITRDLVGENVTLEIADFKELSVIEVTPVVLGLRG